MNALKHFWIHNPVLSTLLGLCPLLAVSTSFATSFTLGILTLLVLVISVALSRILRSFTKPSIRLMLFMLYIGFLTVLAQVILARIAYPLTLSVGIFLPLIITNCLVLSQSEQAHSRNLSLLDACMQGFKTGMGFFVMLILIGSVREVLGSGTLFDGMNMLLPFWQGHIDFSSFQGIPLMLLPSGAFFVLAFFSAVRAALLSQESKKQESI